MARRILITGGAGYIGSVLVQKLIAARREWTGREFALRKESPWCFAWDKVTVYDNLMYKQTPLLDVMYRQDIEFIHGDVRDEVKLKKAVDEADVIIPLAALVGVSACDKDPMQARAVNRDHVEFVCNWRQKGTQVIYPNSNSGYGVGTDGVYCTEESPLNPISLYGITKCAAEQYVLKGGGVSFRLATVFGASQRMRLDLLVNDFVYKAMTDGYIVLFEKDFKRNYIHVQDVALAFTKAIVEYDDLKGQTFNLGLTTANLSKHELALKIKEYIPNFSIQVDEFSKDKDQRNYIVSNKKLESRGWRSYYTLDDGIKELMKVYKLIIPSLNEYTNR